MEYAEVQAWELYKQIQRHGWAMVEALHPWRLTEQEAEALFLRLDWLTQHMPTLLRHYFQQESDA